MSGVGLVMMEKSLKYAFAIVGGITGYTVTRFAFLSMGLNPYSFSGICVIVIVAVAFGILMLVIGAKTVSFAVIAVEKAEKVLMSLTLYELMICAGGLIAGLIVANLLSVAFMKIQVIGIPLTIITNILFGSLGVFLALSKRNENILENKKLQGFRRKILDTSVIIDGRILDVCRTGFIEGELIIPDFVLEELKRLADSHDDLIRTKGRRGLDVLNLMKNENRVPVKIFKTKYDVSIGVDGRLMQFAKDEKACIITNDYNLNKVASISGISILNINDLSSALKPLAVSGEEMRVKIVKEGKENGQGVGYLEDGTMVVVEGACKYKGCEVDVIVTSVLQTSAGRMIFAKFKSANLSMAK
ncbi:PilT/Pin/TRAM domain-containing protein [Thermoclostridium stercorarium subsp. stercorarium DSM 8532]|uniref:PilT/Pin/TRAM domain-containing protein n=1 Tax=Thermoclostridium stercorarium (strain ATCC 35414 / DSM 8532 / NCIMB 11754) TaxID=1121335 RepID=L7VP27_THES1|nr:PilT/Pin/TRAM domain-containing protein [Thermoclostridium stercorarium subsp. stercorarium DSM 8532]